MEKQSIQSKCEYLALAEQALLDIRQSPAAKQEIVHRMVSLMPRISEDICDEEVDSIIDTFTQLELPVAHRNFLGSIDATDPLLSVQEIIDRNRSG